MSRWRKKPVVIDAVQLRWDSWSEMCEHLGPDFFRLGGSGGPLGDDIQLSIPTLEGVMLASENDWIIKGVKGEFYPCKPDIFALTYEEVSA
jgi:hypothetical protein